MTEVKLNLARKWRSQQFDQIIGQELCVRMLKNSLYLGHFFPVYLFSGQRGCGKTTAARVFASALNCEQLPIFQKAPQQNPVPCLVCVSCKSMAAGNHPDFIEIDAASHTGVDNVRNIVEASSLLPVMGGKKIYLIDEAHMLSKAAFNAFLKVLEEPPMGVLFILATTDPQKIIPTVTSRCFQLFFKPVQEVYLVEHLKNICKKERIRFDEAGLRLIVQETQGSVRDAINMLEQVRFSSSSVNKQSVLQVLGHVDDAHLIAVCSAVVESGPAQIVRLIHESNLSQFSAEFLWQRLVAAFRAMIWLKYGVTPDQFSEHVQQLRALSQRCTLKQLQQMLGILYDFEMPFLKTTAQHTMLELVLLQCNQVKNNGINEEGGAAPAAQTVIASDDSDEAVVANDEEDEQESDESDEDEEEESEDALRALWLNFSHEIDLLHEPIIASVFKQGIVTSFDIAKQQLFVQFPKELSFFMDKIDQLRTQWQPVLNTVFGKDISVQLLFTKENDAKQDPIRAASVVTPIVIEKNKVTQNVPYRSSQSFQQPKKFQPRESVHTLLGPVVDISSLDHWPKANLINSYFPGTITEVMAESNS